MAGFAAQNAALEQGELLTTRRDLVAPESLMLRLTQTFNVTGHPAIAMPCGMTPDGLPCSVQLVGRRMQTDALLRVALACEPQISGNASRP